MIWEPAKPSQLMGFDTNFNGTNDGQLWCCGCSVPFFLLSPSGNTRWAYHLCRVMMKFTVGKTNVCWQHPGFLTRTVNFFLRFGDRRNMGESQLGKMKQFFMRCAGLL